MDKFQKLVKLTIEKICDGTAEKEDLLDLGTRVTSVAHKIGESRNKASFASHGQDIDHPKLSNTLSNFMFLKLNILSRLRPLFCFESCGLFCCNTDLL